MQNTYSNNLDQVTDHILPMTELRRNPGEAFKKLNKVGGLVITKDGKPVAKLLPLTQSNISESKKDKLQKLQSLSGGFKIGRGLTPKKINQLINRSYE